MRQNTLWLLSINPAQCIFDPLRISALQASVSMLIHQRAGEMPGVRLVAQVPALEGAVEVAWTIGSVIDSGIEE